MPTPTYTPLATVTLGSSASSVSFSSIPATYRDLIFVIEGTNSNSGVDIGVRLNSDTGGNYTYVSMWGTGSLAQSGSGTVNLMNFHYQANTNRFNAILQIMDYSATDKHKTGLSRGNNSSSQTFANAMRWANTAAVTSLTCLPSAGTLSTGTTFNLYGVIA